MLQPLRRVAFLLLLASVLPAQDREVVVYVSHDQEHSQVILELFEERTGIKVKANYDTEDNKTVGLVTRIIEEKDSPVADVFWNNECGHTVRLKNMGLLQPYQSPAAANIPAEFKDPEHYWTGFGARSRVIVWNRDLISEAELPQTLDELVDPKWKGRITIAKPLTGTTRTQLGALYASWGEERTEKWLDALADNEVLWERGNGPVAQAVAEGVRPIGLTDTDDVNGRRVDGFPIDAHYLGQKEGGEGCLVIPNSVMMIRGARNEDAAKQLIDFLLTPEVEKLLAEGRAAQMPLNPGVDVPAHVRPVGDLKAFKVSFEDTGAMLEKYGQALEKRFTLAGTGSEGASGNSSLIILGGIVGALVGAVVVRSMRKKTA